MNFKGKTPTGVVKFAHIYQAEDPFNTGKPFYSLSLVFDPADPEWVKFKAELDKANDDAYNEMVKNNKLEAKKPSRFDIWSIELDKDGRPTGKDVIKLKAYPSLTDQKTGATKEISIRVYDVFGKETKEQLNIGNGTTAKALISAKGFYTPASKVAGASLWFSAIQIVNLVEYGGSNPFGDESGGQELTF